MERGVIDFSAYIEGRSEVRLEAELHGKEEGGIRKHVIVTEW